MEQVLVVNPHASRVTPDLTLAVEHELAASGAVETLLTERPKHAAELAAEASRKYDRIFVYSGDGTYNEVVNGLERDIPLGFVPGGGTSVLPRALGLPRDPIESARLLARGATPTRISLGRVNGRRFTFSAGLGLDAELVRRVDALGRESGRRAGDVAFARALLGILAEHRGRFDPAMEVVGVGRVAFAPASSRRWRGGCSRDVDTSARVTSSTCTTRTSCGSCATRRYRFRSTAKTSAT